MAEKIIELQDLRLTQGDTNDIMAPMELDLLSLFTLIKNDALKEVEKEGTPEGLIESIISMLE